MTTLYYHGATPALAADAKQILIDLCETYPGHPWDVQFEIGILIISTLNRGTNKRYTIATKVSQFGYSASALKRVAIMAAGEWLERCGMPRGRIDVDQEITRIEGVPEKDQPRIWTPSVGDGMPERTELMPQVFTQ